MSVNCVLIFFFTLCYLLVIFVTHAFVGDSWAFFSLKNVMNEWMTSDSCVTASAMSLKCLSEITDTESTVRNTSIKQQTSNGCCCDYWTRIDRRYLQGPIKDYQLLLSFWLLSHASI